jgi:hypothetical protein
MEELTLNQLMRHYMDQNGCSRRHAYRLAHKLIVEIGEIDMAEEAQYKADAVFEYTGVKIRLG